MAEQDMQGKTVVITGASSGLGAVAAKRLAERGATVVPIGRSPEKTKRVAAELGVEPLIADFAELAQVRTLADQVLERCPQIDVLANNAGGLFSEHVTTTDGHELTFQANHLGPFLLTNLLRERLESTPGARILNTASVANRGGKVDVDDLDYERRRWHAFRVYATSKLLNILFTRELARRFTGVPAACFHPGPVKSDFGRDSLATGLIYRTPLARVFTITTEKGAEPLVALAMRPDAQAIDGTYFDRLKPNGAENGQAGDADLARALWERSAAMAGIA